MATGIEKIIPISQAAFPLEGVEPRGGEHSIATCNAFSHGKREGLGTCTCTPCAMLEAMCFWALGSSHGVIPCALGCLCNARIAWARERWVHSYGIKIFHGMRIHENLAYPPILEWRLWMGKDDCCEGKCGGLPQPATFPASTRSCGNWESPWGLKTMLPPDEFGCLIPMEGG